MEPSSASSQPQITLLIENFRKSNNWGPLLRCCAAFGISQIFVVGFDQCNVRGSHGASKHVELFAFPDHKSAVAALDENNFELMGVLHGAPNAYDKQGYSVVKEINHEKNETTALLVSQGAAVPSTTSDNDNLPKSFPVSGRPFSQRTCLVVGKKTMGLTWSLAQHCRRFIHVPHEGPTNMPCAWLTIEASLSIILHDFFSWAGCNKDSTQYQGQKYQVERKSKGSEPNNKNELRKQRHKELQEMSDDFGGNLLLMENQDIDNGDY